MAMAHVSHDVLNIGSSVRCATISEAEPFAQLNRQGVPPEHNPARFFECSQAQNLSHSQLEQIK